MTMEFIEANWPIIIVVVLLVLLIGWYLFHASRKTTVSSDKRDVLDEGAASAARNQALIDSAPSATKTDGVPVADPAQSRETVVEPAPVSPSTPTPAPAPEPVQVAPAVSDTKDDLTRIKGVGPKLAKMLGEMGVTSFVQIAKWDAAEIARVDAQLGRFQGRIERDSWVEQAGFLAADDLDGYAAKYGNVD